MKFNAAIDAIPPPIYLTGCQQAAFLSPDHNGTHMVFLATMAFGLLTVSPPAFPSALQKELN